MVCVLQHGLLDGNVCNTFKGVYYCCLGQNIISLACYTCLLLVVMADDAHSLAKSRGYILGQKKKEKQLTLAGLEPAIP